MHDLHIGDFYKDVAGILITLYMRFPQKSTLYIEDINGPDTPDEFGLHSPRHLSCFSAALWLAEEGYLRFTQTIHQDALDEVVLTQAAFLFFSSPDDPLTALNGSDSALSQHNSAATQGDTDLSKSGNTQSPHLISTRIAKIKSLVKTGASADLNSYMHIKMQLFHVSAR